MERSMRSLKRVDRVKREVEDWESTGWIVWSAT